MSTSAAAPRREWWPAFGHHAWKIQMGAVIGVIASFPFGTGGALTRTLLILVLFAGMVAQRSHDRKLCEPCIAGMPLNPQVDIVKHRRALAVAHSLDWAEGRVSYRVMRLLILLAIVGINSIIVALPRPYSDIASTVVLTLTGVILAWSLQMHGRLEPWCPKCRGDDGGDDTFNPDPTPTPSREKELT